MVGTSSDKETYQESNSHKPNNKLHTFRTTHTRWNSDTQIITNNIPSSPQLYKRDEWREDNKQDSFSSSPPSSSPSSSSPPSSFSSSPPTNHRTNNNTNYPRKRLSASTSFQQSLDPEHPKTPPLGTDRFSLSKLLAQRRASAPILSHAQQQERKNAQHNTHSIPHPPQIKVARSKGASKEVYGFVCWITTFVAYAFYLLWGYLPKQFLQSLGVHYLPKRYWVVAVPSYLMVAILFGILIYVCFNLINTPSLDSFHTFSDTGTPEHYRQEHENSIPAATDIPLTLVNELLYQKRKASELSPTFPKFGNPHTTRSRVFFDNKNKKSAEDLRGDWDASFSSTESAESDGEDMRGGGREWEASSSSSPYHEYPKRTLHSYSPFSSSPDSSPIRRTSSYSLLKEENM